jgi:Tol biopolymer transport system component
MRLSVPLPAGWDLSLANRQGVPTSLVISPDGRRVAIVAKRGQGSDTILLRSVDSTVAQPLVGTEGVSSMFWSPDSRFLAFYANGRLMKIDVTGGPPATVADVRGNFGGGTWSRDGTIVFSALGTGNYALQKVSAEGGVPTDVWPDSASADVQVSRIRPSFLPDGRHLLYATVVVGQLGGPTIAIEVGSLDSSERVQVVNSGSTNVQYVQGHLLYLRDATLMAQPFDTDRLALVGEAVPVAEQIQRQGVQPPYGIFSASADGVLVYQTGTNTGTVGGALLAWVDRSGKALDTVSVPGNYNSVALSPDGSRAVVGELVPLADLWTVDLKRGVKTRLTFGAAQVFFPVWSPDGSQIAFASPRSGPPNILVKAANGAGGEDPLTSSGILKFPSDWSRDGRYLLVGQEAAAGSRMDLMALAIKGDRKPFPVLTTPFNHFPATFSPDGHWIAYSSDESGRSEVYVTPFIAPEATPTASGTGTSPVTGAKQQVSPGGGDFARWRADGRELYYVSPAPDQTLMAAEVSVQDGVFTIHGVKPLFRLALPSSGTAQGWFYDVSPDGQRFLIIEPQEVKGEAASPPTIAINWLPRAQP